MTSTQVQEAYDTAVKQQAACLSYCAIGPETRESRYLEIYRRAISANNLTLALNALIALDEKAGL